MQLLNQKMDDYELKVFATVISENILFAMTTLLDASKKFNLHVSVEMSVFLSLPAAFTRDLSG